MKGKALVVNIIWFLVTLALLLKILNQAAKQDEMEAELLSQLSAVQTDLITLGNQVEDLSNDKERLNQNLSERESEVLDLRTQYALLEETLKALQSDLSRYELSSFEEAYLQEKGIVDPGLLTADLMNQSHIIESQPVLGGTMYFTKAVLLNHRLCYASFEDGHIMGYGLYSFEISQGQIQWQSIIEIMD